MASVLELPGAEVVLAGDPRQAWRAMISALPILALLAAGGLVTLEPTALAALVVFSVPGLLRVGWWRASAGSVQVIATADLLVGAERGRVALWVRWADVDQILLRRPSWRDPWQRNPRGAAVHVDPFTRLQPPQAFVTDLARPLLSPSSFDRDVVRLRTVAQARGVRVQDR